MTRYIDNKQLKNIFNKLNVKRLKVNDISKSIQILENIHKYLINIKYMSIYLRQRLRNELENIVFLLRYMNLSTDEYIKVVEILSKVDEKDLSMNDKIQFLDKQELYNSNLDLKIIEILDSWLYDELSNYIIKNNSLDNSYTNICRYIHVKDKDYISKIDNLVNSQIDYLDSDKLLNIVYLSPVLSEETLLHLKYKIIDNLNNNFDFNLFERSIRYRVIRNGKDFEIQVYEYIKELEKTRPIDIVVYPDVFKETLETLGILIFRKDISKEMFREFTTYSNKLSFLINPNEFDYSHFEDEWVLEYNKTFHEAISKTKAGFRVKHILEKYIRNGQCDEYILELYFDVYHKLRVSKHKKKSKRKFIK